MFDQNQIIAISAAGTKDTGPLSRSSKRRYQAGPHLRRDEGSGRYYFISGKRRESLWTTDRAEAERRFRRRLDGLDIRVALEGLPKAPETPPLAQIIDEHLIWVYTRKKRRKDAAGHRQKMLSPKTGIASYLEQHGINVCDVDLDVARDHLGQLEDRGLKNATINRYAASWMVFARWCHRPSRYIDAVPFAWEDLVYPEEKRSKKRPLPSVEAFEQIMAHVP